MSKEIKWKPDRELDSTLQTQIKEYIKRQISSGSWELGTKIPTQRQMANDFGVNRSTVVSVIDDLISEGILESRTKGGTVIVNNTWSLFNEKKLLYWTDYTNYGSYKPNDNISKEINSNEMNPDIIRLGSGSLSRDIIDEPMIKRLSRALINNVDYLGYEDPKGVYELRVEICKYLKESGISVMPNQVLIVSGAIQALYLISVGILKRNSTILTEMPSYIYSVNVFQSAGMNLYGLPMDDEGIIISNIKKSKTKTRASILYTNPKFHNPTGINMTDKRAKELLSICNAERLPIIEDDTYRELFFEIGKQKPLKSFDTNGLVLHLGSLSKIMFPGLRLGWIVGQESIIDRMADIKSQVDLGASTYSQYAAIELFKTGIFDEYVSLVRSKLQKRRDVALDLLNNYFYNIAEWKIPDGGFYIWLKLNKKAPLKKIFNACLSKGVLIHPGIIYHHSADRYIRISYASATESELFEGIKILSGVIKMYV
jgi:GntR family transcriptional regulator of abcA and norABC